MKSVTMSIRVDANTKAALDKLAKKERMTVSKLVGKKLLALAIPQATSNEAFTNENEIEGEIPARAKKAQQTRTEHQQTIYALNRIAAMIKFYHIHGEQGKVNALLGSITDYINLLIEGNEGEALRRFKKRIGGASK